MYTYILFGEGEECIKAVEYITKVVPKFKYVIINNEELITLFKDNNYLLIDLENTTVESYEKYFIREREEYVDKCISDYLSQLYHYEITQKTILIKNNNYVLVDAGLFIMKIVLQKNLWDVELFEIMKDEPTGLFPTIEYINNRNDLRYLVYSTKFENISTNIDRDDKVKLELLVIKILCFVKDHPVILPFDVKLENMVKGCVDEDEIYSFYLENMESIDKETIKEIKKKYQWITVEFNNLFIMCLVCCEFIYGSNCSKGRVLKFLNKLYSPEIPCLQIL